MTIGFMSLFYIAQKAYGEVQSVSLLGNLLLGIFSMVIWFVSLFFNQGVCLDLNSEGYRSIVDARQSGEPLHVNIMGNRDGSGLDRWTAKEVLTKANIMVYDQLLPYVIVQFYPIVALCYMIFTWPSSAELSLWYLLPTFILYILAKVLEAADLKSEYLFKSVCQDHISGHSLKHLSAGLAAISLIVFIINVD